MPSPLAASSELQSTSPSADRDTHRALEHRCPSAPSWMWKRVLQPPKTSVRKTHWNESKAFGDGQCLLCCRAPQGCGCSSNTQRSTDTGCRQAQLLFRPRSPIRVHLNSSPYHLSSLTSSIKESRAASLIPCSQLPQADRALNNYMGLGDCQSPC